MIPHTVSSYIPANRHDESNDPRSSVALERAGLGEGYGALPPQLAVGVGTSGFLAMKMWTWTDRGMTVTPAGGRRVTVLTTSDF